MYNLKTLHCFLPTHVLWISFLSIYTKKDVIIKYKKNNAGHLTNTRLTFYLYQSAQSSYVIAVISIGPLIVTNWCELMGSVEFNLPVLSACIRYHTVLYIV